MDKDEFAERIRSIREQGLPHELTELLSPRTERALGHPLRRQILRELHRSDETALTVTELALAIQPPTSVTQLNYHANVLETCDLVRAIEPEATPDGDCSRRYASTANRDVQIVSVLAATETRDGKPKPPTTGTG